MVESAWYRARDAHEVAPAGGKGAVIELFESIDEPADHMKRPMRTGHDWRVLPLIIVMALLIGWISGQLVSMLASPDMSLSERPRLSPR
jgi:hypothetical protein